MTLMITITQPLSSIPESAKVFLKSKDKPLPDYLKLVNMYTAWGGDGAVGYEFYHIEDGRVDEGLRELSSRTLEFSSVPGLKVKWEIVTPIKETLSAVGKKL